MTRYYMPVSTPLVDALTSEAGREVCPEGWSIVRVVTDGWESPFAGCTLVEVEDAGALPELQGMLVTPMFARNYESNDPDADSTITITDRPVIGPISLMKPEGDPNA